MLALDAPFRRFDEVFSRAKDAAAKDGTDATAVTLATASRDGRPAARIVLLKSVDTLGFVFFTNYESQKGRDLAENAQAALLFYWPALGEQVRVEGTVEKVTPAESEAYFASRPRESQLGAWASAQSRVIASREVLLANLREVTARFEGKNVTRPPHWGGYRLAPRAIEFWRNGEHRLHERERYDREGDSWRVSMLSP